MAELGDVTGSVPDVIGSVLSITEALRAGKGFVFNTCTFTIKRAPAAQTSAPASAATPPAKGAAPGKPLSQASPAPPQQQGITASNGPLILEVKTGTPGEPGGVQQVAALGIRQLAAADRVIGVVELRHLNQEFDAGTDSVAVEINVVKAGSQAALLVIKGFANPGGIGYAHLLCGLLVSVDAGPQPTLRSKVTFLSQAPEPQTGTGIFGKTVYVDDLGSHLEIRMQRTPLFNR
ncbi:hypothetical protein [Streptomyces chartreusis]